MVAPLPPELTDAIIGHVAGYDTATLKACALVSHSFLAASRSPLFSIVKLTAHTVENFRQLLSSPQCTIASRVERLRFGDTTSRFSPTSVDNIPLTLAALPNLKYLSIWSYFREPLPLPIVYPPNLNHLIELELIGIRFESVVEAISFVCSFPSLRTVLLIGVSWHVSSAVIPSDIRLPSHLGSIRLMAGCKEFVSWMLRLYDLSPANLRSISSLTFDGVSAEETPAIDRLITAVAGCLKYLAIYFKPQNAPSENILCGHPLLASIPTVRILAHSAPCIVRSTK